MLLIGLFPLGVAGCIDRIRIYGNELLSLLEGVIGQKCEYSTFRMNYIAIEWEVAGKGGVRSLAKLIGDAIAETGVSDFYVNYSDYSVVNILLNSDVMVYKQP